MKSNRHHGAARQLAPSALASRSGLAHTYRGGLLLDVTPLRRLLDQAGLSDIELSERTGLSARRVHALRTTSLQISEVTLDLIGVRVFGEPQLCELLHPEVDWTASPPRVLRAPDPDLPLPRLAVGSIELTQVRVAA